MYPYKRPGIAIAASLIFLMSFLSHCQSFAQAAQWAWAGGGTGNDAGYACKVAPNGNICVAGTFNGTMDLDPSSATYNITSNGLGDMYLACYTPNGTFLWGFNVGGSSYDAIWDISIDAQGNIFTTGSFRGIADFDPSSNTANLYDNTVGTSSQVYGGDIFIAKYSAMGAYQWAVGMGDHTTHDLFHSIAVDESGYVYAGGVFIDNMDVDPSANVVNLFSGNGKCAIVKFTPNGQLVWGKNFSSPGGANVNTDVRGMVVKGGHIYCAGFFQTTADFDPSAGVASFTSSGLYDGFVAKYDTAGNYVFAIPISGNDYDDALDLRLDASNNIYISGFTHSSNIDFSPYVPSNVVAPVGGNSRHIMMARYSNTGTYQWGKIIGNTASDEAWDLEISNNKIYLVGNFENTVDFDPSTTINNLVGNGGPDIFLCQYDLNGNYICGFNIGGTTPQIEVAHKITSGPNGELYLAGAYAGSNVDFDPSSNNIYRNCNGMLDAFLVKYTFTAGSNSFTVTGDTICAGQQAYLTVTDTVNGGVFTVTVNDGINSYTLINLQSGVPFALTPSPIATTTYTWSIAGGGGNACVSSSSSGSFTIIVNPQPIADAGPDITMCTNAFVQLNGSGGGTYTWSPGSVLNNAGIANPALTVTDTTLTFAMIVANTSGCSDTDYVNVSVHQGVAMANAGPDTSVCPGFPVQLQGSSNGTYSWYPVGNLSNPNIPNPIFTGGSNATLTLVATDQYNCKDSDEVTIFMLPQPVATAGADVQVCAGAPVTLQAGGGTSYNWYPTTGMTGSNTASPTVTVTGNTIYYVIATDMTGCTDTDAVLVAVTPRPDFTVSSPPDVCISDSAQLQASGGNVYYWYPNEKISDNTAATVTVWPQATTTYYVAITEPVCNYKDTQSVTVNIYANPAVKITQSSPIGCGNDRSQLIATGAMTYKWTPATTLDNDSIANPKSGTKTDQWYTVRGTDQYGCTGQDSALVRIVGDNMTGLFVPSAFTPNGDGKNDCYRILQPAGITDYELHIYNRFGNNVFNADDASDCWDGYYEGQLCDVGVYFYYYKFKSPTCGKTIEGKGDVTLVR